MQNALLSLFVPPEDVCPHVKKRFCRSDLAMEAGYRQWGPGVYHIDLVKLEKQKEMFIPGAVC